MAKRVTMEIDGKAVIIPQGITITKAMEFRGYRITKYPEEGSYFAPCEIGGCWSCAVEVDGKLKPACITPVKDSLRINTELSEDSTPKRIIHGFSGHPVGGVGTPWWLKRYHGYIEAACFAAGCNLRCPQCQNWDITYSGKGSALTPLEAAERMTAARRQFQVDRMAISGGESTLNRNWLVQYVEGLRRLNPDPNARIHIDTNATILTKDYIDELVEAGMTDIGPDLKGYHPDTFMRITAIEDHRLATRYLNTAWDAVRYLSDRYKGEVFMGVGIPFNRDLIPLEEIGLMGETLCEIDPEIQVCVLDYRPEYRRSDLVKPKYEEMVEVHKTLTGEGLKTVTCQTDRGHIGPQL